jgi:hypothetical protein
MPIEASAAPTPAAIPASVGHAFVEECRDTLRNAVAKIDHCLDQLSDSQMGWRPSESHNSIQNIILHLCGNVQQWIINGTTGGRDDRNRPLEFSDHRPYSKRELQAKLRDTIARADSVLTPLDAAQLLAPRRIQGFETYLMAAIFDSVSHFVGHTHQIVYITRMIIGDSYRFQFVPQTVEQGAPQ